MILASLKSDLRTDFVASCSSVLLDELFESIDPCRINGLVQPQRAPTRISEIASVTLIIVADGMSNILITKTTYDNYVLVIGIVAEIFPI